MTDKNRVLNVYIVSFDIFVIGKKLLPQSEREAIKAKCFHPEQPVGCLRTRTRIYGRGKDGKKIVEISFENKQMKSEF